MNFSNDGFVFQYNADGKGIASDTNFDESIITSKEVAHSTIIEEDEYPPNQELFHKKKFEKLETDYVVLKANLAVVKAKLVGKNNNGRR